jgi:hypothetical protein
MKPQQRLARLLATRRDEAIELSALAVVTMIAQQEKWPVHLGAIGTMLLGVLLVPSKPAESGAPPKRWWQRLVWLAVLAAAAAGVNHLLLGGSFAVIWMSATWLGLILSARVAESAWRTRARWSPPLQQWAAARQHARLVEGVAPALLIFGASRLWAALDPATQLPIVASTILAFLWVLLDRLPWGHWQQASTMPALLVRLMPRIIGWSMGAAVVAVSWRGAFDGGAVGSALFASASVFAWTCTRGTVPWTTTETVRRLAAVALGAGTVWSFAATVPIGAGDASWYAATLADVITQVRSGVFPVFVGQSEFQFNGSVFPVRVAPLFHHLAIALDTLSLQTLTFGALQNLTLIVTGALAGSVAYACLATLLPNERGSAWFIAALYLLCPGVLAVVHGKDLYMTWTTVPWLPVVLLGAILSFRDPGWRPLLLLVGGLGLLWWGHSPIALWTTSIVGAMQVVRILQQRFQPDVLLRTSLAGALWALLVAYPLVSVLFVPPEATRDATSYAVALPDAIALFIRETFPAAWLPVSSTGRELADSQLGWTWWLALGLILATALRVRRIELICLAAISSGVALLLIPLPVINEGLWRLVPGAIRNPTGNWAMTRLCLVLSGLIAFGVALALPAWDRWRRIWPAIALVCLGWGMLEASKFWRGTANVRTVAGNLPSPLAFENLTLTRYSYLMFGGLPPTFSHGVIDPTLEHRLLRRTDLALLASNTDAAAGPAARETTRGMLVGEREGSGWRLTPQLILQPRARYVLEVNPNRRDSPGVLVIAGGSLRRIYALPEYGESRAFGSGPESSPYVPLQVTGEQPATVQLSFVPEAASAGLDFTLFGTYRLSRYDEQRLPVRVEGWIPYRARVTALEPAWLETPRMYQMYYRATVDGTPADVRKSPAGFAMIAIPAGDSQIELRFAVPWRLWSAYVASAAGFAFLAGLGLKAHFRRRPNDPAGETPNEARDR